MVTVVTGIMRLFGLIGYYSAGDTTTHVGGVPSPESYGLEDEGQVLVVIDPNEHVTTSSNTTDILMSEFKYVASVPETLTIPVGWYSYAESGDYYKYHLRVYDPETGTETTVYDSPKVQTSTWEFYQHDVTLSTGQSVRLYVDTHDYRVHVKDFGVLLYRYNAFTL